MTDFDVLVIGGGHAGAESAWAASRLGARTVLVTLDTRRIGQMSCNPAIGGQAKGQMVREVDALGGLMGRATDATGIQFRMLNRSKGPAVWGPRAQCDKDRYAAQVQTLLRECPGLTVIEGEVAGLAICDPSTNAERVARFAVEIVPPDARPRIASRNSQIRSRAVVVTTGTFMSALMHTGEHKSEGGRVGEASSRSISASLRQVGLELGRLKTGTPPRLHRDSIDYSKFTIQPGDAEPMPFSFLNEYEASWCPALPQTHCWLGTTNQDVHDVIRANLHRAPMFSGQIQSTGPRYCPSIEDKVHRFADKPQHQLFLEPETLEGDSIYVNGISTSLPADVQERFVRSIPGLEKAAFLRYGYAVEYDVVWPHQIDATLQTKRVPGLFLAGQINGTSGYEEAAAQGLVAGVNAARLALGGRADFVLRRDQAYIGVLIDDLVTKPPTEPYRMFTSRAEHRLLLRADNADERLTPPGRDIGLVDDSRWSSFVLRREEVDVALRTLRSTRREGVTLEELLRRPEHTWDSVAATVETPSAVARLAEIRVKYAGYIARQDRSVEQLAKMESRLIPPELDYTIVAGLRNEARDKLRRYTPRSLGQALRISGITPADVSLLAVHLTRLS